MRLAKTSLFGSGPVFAAMKTSRRAFESLRCLNINDEFDESTNPVHSLPSLLRNWSRTVFGSELSVLLSSDTLLANSGRNKFR